MSNLREKLKQVYDEFVEKYGLMNSQKNRRIILKHPQGQMLLASVEVKIDTGYVASDILTKSVTEEVVVYRTDNVVEALSHVLGTYGYVALDKISEITDLEPELIIEGLGDLIYLNPNTEQYETADKYLSGNVYAKFIAAKQACEYHQEYAGIPNRLQRSYDAIKEVIPQQIPWDLLTFQLGERWISAELYMKFSEWLFQIPIVILYLPSTDTYKTDAKSKRWNSHVMTREYVVSPKGARNNTMYGDELLEHALHSTTPHFTYTNGAGEKIPDNDSIQLANEKIEDMRHKFTEWLQELPADEKDALVDTYNNTYNCYVIRKYNGSHMMLPGIDMEALKSVYNMDEIRPAQKDGVWRIIQDNGAIIDWQVGAGKSILQVCAAHEMKRMGIRRKPAILCLKANIADITKLYRTAYPKAKILAPSEKDFEKVNRQRLFHEIKNNDWDCVIMTHDQFGKIPQSDQIQEEILQEEVDNLDRDLDVISNAGYNVSRTMRKGLEQRKQTLLVKLKTIQDRITTGQDDINFDQMGIDHLLIDESHRFKSLTFTTRHDRVAGIGNQQGSQKALNMLFAIRTLQKRFDSDLQCTFLSGTPISNSLTEMYLLFKYLRPKELARQNIMNFDAWAAVFAKKTTDFEFSVTNQIQSKERFRHFIKVPELALFYNEIADYKTNKSINIDKPEMVEELVPLTPTDDQKEFIQNLIRYAKTGMGEYIGRDDLIPNGPGDTARMLIATNYAKKMSTDMRLINPDLYDDHPNNKISVCCKRLSEQYHRFSEQKGVQLVFCDLGVPDNKGYDDGDGKKKKKWTVYQAMKDKLVEEYELPADEIVFIHDYNEKTRGKLFKQVNDGVVRIMIGSTDKAGTGVNVQQRVVTIHDLDIPWKPAELEQRGGRGARQGNWVAKLYQDNIVYRYIYATEQSLDTYKFTLLKNKQTFISQMKTNELQVRSIDEGSFDEANGMNFAEYIAVLSGDTTLLEKAKIDKKLAILENLKVVHYREIHNNKYLLEHKISRKAEVDEITECVQRDWDQYSSLMTRDATGTKNNPIVIDAIQDQVRALEIQIAAEEMAKEISKQEKRNLRMLKMKTERVEETEEEPKSTLQDPAQMIGEWLVEKWRTWHPKVSETNEKLGQLLGFNLYIQRVTATEDGLTARRGYTGPIGSNIMFSNQLYAQHTHGGLKYLFNHGIPSRENSKLAARIFINAIARSEQLLAQYKDEQSRLAVDIVQLSKLDAKPFSRENEINTLHEESKRLEQEITSKLNASKMEPV